MALKIKVCGMKDPANIEALLELKPDYMGFIFYERSLRFVKDLDVNITKNIPIHTKATGVFVNETIEQVMHLAKIHQLKALQLHGNESPDYCLSLKAELPDIELIKAFGVNEKFNFESLNEYLQAVDYFLFDTQTEKHGGSGKAFNWQLLGQYKLEKPYFLSGGIGPEHVIQINEIVDPRLYAIDLNSRFETQPAFKDIEQLIHFKNQLLGRP